MVHFLLLILLGLAGGFVGGMFGIGGGVLVVPALVLFFGFSQHMAQGTMIMTFILPSFLLAAWTYYKAGNVNLPVALLIALGMLAGTFLGATYAHTLSTPVLKKCFGALVIVVGLRMILGK